MRGRPAVEVASVRAGPNLRSVSVDEQTIENRLRTRPPRAIRFEPKGTEIRTTNRVPRVLHLQMGRQACLQLIIKYILDMATLACLTVQLVHTLGTWPRFVPWPPLAGTSTTGHRRVRPFAVGTILILATWGRRWHQLLEALGNFAL